MALGCVLGLPVNKNEQGQPVYEAGVLFAQCLGSIAPAMNFQTATIQVAGERIDVARNKIVEQALESGAEYLLFFDSDVLFPPQTFQVLLNRARNNNHKIISGVYFSKSNPTFPLIFHEPGLGSYLDWKVGDYFKTWAIGMGCVLIHMDVFRTVEKPWYAIDYGLHHDRETGALGASSMTEDLPFCDKCKEAGIDIYVDAGLQCGHFDKRTGQIFGLNDSMPQAEGREPKESKTLYIGNLIAGGEPAHVLSSDPSILPTWIGTPDRVPTDETYERVCVKDPDVKRENLDEVVKEWARVTSPGGKLEVMHPDYAEWIKEGKPVDSKALYPSPVIEEALKTAGLSDITVNTGDGYHFIHAHKPNANNALVSVIVLGHGLEEMTKQCVDSLRTTKTRHNFEIVVVDNASPVPYQKMGDKQVRNETNLPFGQAIQEGVKASTGTYLVLSNNDVVYHHTEWLDNLLDRIRGSGQVVAVGPKQITPTGTIYHAGTAFDENRIPFHSFVGFGHDFHEVQVEREVLALCFGCCLVRRETFEKYPLDPMFDDIGNYEDVDWCLTVRQKGFQLIYTPSAEVIHFGGRTQSEDPERSRRCIDINRARLLEKWKDAPDELFGLGGNDELETADGKQEGGEAIPDSTASTEG